MNSVAHHDVSKEKIGEWIDCHLRRISAQWNVYGNVGAVAEKVAQWNKSSGTK